MTDQHDQRVMPPGMSSLVPTRFSDEELALIDELVRSGVGDSRSAASARAMTEAEPW